jgi:hypothetical protein
MSGRPVIHCWEDRRLTDPHEEPATCLLEDGHQGEHEWTPDSEIVLSFGPTVEVIDADH